MNEREINMSHTTWNSIHSRDTNLTIQTNFTFISTYVIICMLSLHNNV